MDDYICCKVENGDRDFIRSRDRLILKKRQSLPKSHPKKMKSRISDRLYEPYQQPNSYKVKLRSFTMQEVGISFDVDVKPNIHELAYASGASIPYAANSPDTYDEDVKPTLTDLNQLSLNPPSYPIDIDEEVDVKPDIKILDALIESRQSAAPFVPVILSVGSTRPQESSMSPLSTSPLRLNGNEENKYSPDEPPTLKIKICKVSSNAWHCKKTEDSKIPIGLRESNFLSPIKKECWIIPNELQKLIEADYLNRVTWNDLQSTDCYTEQVSNTV
jgi:hypothetical protein